MKLLLSFLIVITLGLMLSASAQVMLNEIYYDGPGTDDINAMFTELYGPAGTDLTGWMLVGINGNGGVVYRTIVLQGSIPSDGYYVVGNTASVPNVDFVCGGTSGNGVDWQNAGSASSADCDGVELRNPSSIVVDHVCYGMCAAPGSCEGEGGTQAPDANSTTTIGRAIDRLPDHQDTDDNAADWLISEVTTPGAANVGVPCVPHVGPLSDVRVNDANGVPALRDTFVVVRGIVNVANYVLDVPPTESNFYFQSANAGCDVFRGSVPAGIVEGDCVVVSGWVNHFNGLTEVVSSGPGSCVYNVSVVDHVSPPEPILLTLDVVGEAYEGMLVRVNNVSITSGTWPPDGSFASLPISDGVGVSILRIDEDTQVDGTPPPSPVFDVIGIVTQFDATSPYTEGYQIVPRYPCDIIQAPRAYPELVQMGPPQWGYRLHHVAGCVSEFIFTNFCPGTIGWVADPAAGQWSVMANGDGNDGDTIRFIASTPMSGGTAETFWLSHPTCADLVRWCVGDSCGAVDGPLPVELVGFNAVSGNGLVELSWATASESGLDRFEVLRNNVMATSVAATNDAAGSSYAWTDHDVVNGNTYDYSLVAVDMNGHRQELATESAQPGVDAGVITEYALHQNYPNPFNPSTGIRFDLLEAGYVTLKLYNVTGQEIASLVNGERTAGRHTVTFDASALPSGVYLYQLSVNGFVSAKKMLLMK